MPWNTLPSSCEQHSFFRMLIPFLWFLVLFSGSMTIVVGTHWPVVFMLGPSCPDFLGLPWFAGFARISPYSQGYCRGHCRGHCRGLYQPAGLFHPWTGFPLCICRPRLSEDLLVSAQVFWSVPNSHTQRLDYLFHGHPRLLGYSRHNVVCS